MKYSTKPVNEQGMIVFYQPYPEELRKKKPGLFSIALRVVLVALIALTVVLVATGEATWPTM